MSRSMKSVQIQCCCCTASVFSALFGIIMVSTGVCLVLNYKIMEVDTGGLPPHLQNEEGKKIVGIILICCGLVGIIISTVVTALYFTIFTKPKTSPSVSPSPVATTAASGQSVYRGFSPRAPINDPHSTQLSSHSKSNGSRNAKRGKAKKRQHHLKVYKSRLTPHKEVVNESEPRQENIMLSESSTSLGSSESVPPESNLKHSTPNESEEQTDDQDSQLTTTSIDSGTAGSGDLYTCRQPSDLKRPYSRDGVQTVKEAPDTNVIDDMELQSSQTEVKFNQSTEGGGSEKEDSDFREEEEFSQIEEVKKLDKIVASQTS